MSAKSQLQCVSLTGADDKTSISDLAELSERYPFVEWALLYVPHNEGAPRNPTQSWRESFFEAKLGAPCAVHLCGSLAFEQLASGTLPRDVLKAKRLQLNINARRREFTDEQVLDIYHRALGLGPDIILQYHEDSASLIEGFLDSQGPLDHARTHILLDASKGTGLAPTQWYRPESLRGRFIGHAGALGPLNLASVLARLEEFDAPYWVDMETGLRTDNQLDEHKVEQVLETAHAHLMAS